MRCIRILFARYPFAVPDIFLGDGAPSSAIDRGTTKIFHFIRHRRREKSYSHSVLSFISLVLSGLTDVRNPKIPILFSLKSLIFALKKFFVYFPCTSNVSGISVFATLVSKNIFYNKEVLTFYACFTSKIKHKCQQLFYDVSCL